MELIERPSVMMCSIYSEHKGCVGFHIDRFPKKHVGLTLGACSIELLKKEDIQLVDIDDDELLKLCGDSVLLGFPMHICALRQETDFSMLGLSLSLRSAE